MKYKVIKTQFPEVLILEPIIYNDHRGLFYESFNKKDFELITGLHKEFKQDNHCSSKKNVLRGLHYQIKKPQGKLVRVTKGKILDVVVDLRKSSNNFAKWISVELSSNNQKQIWVPEGFAHGYLVISENADVLYKTTEYWFPEFEACIKWNDKYLSINWPVKKPILSKKDEEGLELKDANTYE
jgi:dTDP-4-dehydrorhamnose 3,5-epimerase